MNQFLSRRTFILIPTMSILKIIFNPMQVLASSLPSKEEWNLSKDEWKARLSPESYYILREEGTERAFSSQLNNEKRKGIFHCAGCDLPLFSSDKKFDSGTGWPSFWDSIQGSVETKVDFKLIVPRTEYHCSRCGGHQGHVFNDGPLPTGKRYCNNGLALRIVLLNFRKMIENQSDNIDNKENDESNLDNAPEDASSTQNSTTENDELSSQEKEEINTEELKNTISNNDARLEQLEKEHETLKNQYVRISADFDNFRKRQSRDQDDLKIQLVSKTLTAILPIVDNFERARQQLKPESEEAQALHRSYQGLYKQLVEVLKQQGVAPMRVVGQQFDPNLHEAVFIIEELQRGYHLEGKVLRHALVKVSMGPGKQNSQQEVEKDTVEGDVNSEANTSEDV